MVLIGDAKATAHFSIGSGTKLAMEDAIALYEAFRATDNSDVATALAHFESRRRDEVEKTQHAADVSLVWFEHVDRFWKMDPTRFAFGLMTRSKAITYDNLALRAPAFVDEVDRVVARDVRALGFPADTAKPLAPMFQPFRLRGLTLENRVVVSPMCQYSAQDGAAERLAPRALRLARHRRRRPDVHRDDRRLDGRAHLAWLHRHVRGRARGRLEAHRRFRACATRRRSSACSSGMPAARARPS